MRTVTRAGNIAPIIVDNNSRRVVTKNINRRAVFIQNTSTTDNIELTTGSGIQAGFVVPLTGAFISDIALVEEIYARNITSTADVTIIVLDIVGFDVFETEMLNMLDKILAQLKAGNR